MSDREMLEFAAKAAGLHRCENYYTDAAGNHVEWSPITDDGDALRLAVKLRMCILVRTFPHSIVVEAYNGEMPSATEALEDVRFDVNSPLAATRRAIVRAAAEIGRQMP